MCVTVRPLFSNVINDCCIWKFKGTFKLILPVQSAIFKVANSYLDIDWLYIFTQLTVCLPLYLHETDPTISNNLNTQYGNFVTLNQFKTPIKISLVLYRNYRGVTMGITLVISMLILSGLRVCNLNIFSHNCSPSNIYKFLTFFLYYSDRMVYLHILYSESFYTQDISHLFILLFFYPIRTE